MAYHVVGESEVLFETASLEQAQLVKRNIATAKSITEGPLEFLRHIAKKKYGQKPSDYPRCHSLIDS